jgi:hypothetical protein
MKTLASKTSLLVCVGCGLLSLGFGSCDGGSSSGGGESGSDSGPSETGAPRDAFGPVDTGVADVFVPVDSAGGDAGEEAGLCGEPLTGLGPTCDGCIATNCEPTWCACADPADAADAGTGCLGYVKCVEACVASDAGSPTDCLTTVCAVPQFPMPEQQAGHSFLDCLVQYCASECGQ